GRRDVVPLERRSARTHCDRPDRGGATPGNPPRVTSIRDAWRVIGAWHRCAANHPGAGVITGGLSVYRTVKPPRMVEGRVGWRVIAAPASPRRVTACRVAAFH